jgi:hypothetical protein
MGAWNGNPCLLKLVNPFITHTSNSGSLSDSKQEIQWTYLDNARFEAPSLQENQTIGPQSIRTDRGIYSNEQPFEGNVFLARIPMSVYRYLLPQGKTLQQCRGPYHPKL